MHLDCDQKETYAINYETRKLSAIPIGIVSVFSQVWRTQIARACQNMRDLRFYGSRFINLHFLRCIHENIPINVTESSLRRWFVAIARGARVSDPSVIASLKVWNSCCPEKYKSPDIRGMNTITTKTFEAYWTAFNNYHTYGLLDHYVSCLRLQHALSKRAAISIAVDIFQRLEMHC